MFKLTLIKPTARYNITPIVADLQWESDLSILTSSEFKIAFSDARFPVPRNPVDVGDHVILTKGTEELFRHVIVNESRTGRGAIGYEAYDYTWYLGQSTTVYQFNKIPASQAIAQILTDFGISIGHIINMPTLIEHIYIQESPAKILNEIIEKVERSEGYTIQGEMRQGKLYLERRKDLVIKGRFRIAENIGATDILNAVAEPKRTRTIEDMRNRIRLIIDDTIESDNEEVEDVASYIVTATAEDRALIERYGLIEETIKMDIEDSAKARQAAKIILERLGRVHENNSLKLMGDTRFKGGRLFDVREPVTGMNGRFMISSVKHRLTNSIHTMDLDLVLPDEVV